MPSENVKTPSPIPGKGEREIHRAILEAVEEERRRLAQVLHDSLCQNMGGLQLLARVQHGCGEAEPTLEGVAELGDLIQRTSTELSELVSSLRAAEVEVQDLAASLGKLAEKTSRPCTFRCEGQVPAVDPFETTQLHLIARGAVRWFSGQQGEIHVDLGVNEDALDLSIRGGDRQHVPAWPERRLMDLRAKAIGATLSLENGMDGTQRVNCRLPLAR